MPFHQNSHMMFPALLKTLQDCEASCEMTSTMLLSAKDVHMRGMQLRYLRDCADICDLTAKYLSRSSGFTKSLVNLCAYVCEVCGKECLKFPDQMSQQCGQICLHCARECKSFAMAA